MRIDGCCRFQLTTINEEFLHCRHGHLHLLLHSKFIHLNFQSALRKTPQFHRKNNYYNLRQNQLYISVFSIFEVEFNIMIQQSLIFEQHSDLQFASLMLSKSSTACINPIVDNSNSYSHDVFHYGTVVQELMVFDYCFQMDYFSGNIGFILLTYSLVSFSYDLTDESLSSFFSVCYKIFLGLLVSFSRIHSQLHCPLRNQKRKHSNLLCFTKRTHSPIQKRLHQLPLICQFF